MPLYQYRCSSCNDEFEVIQSLKDNKLIHCDKCNNDSLEKVLTTAKLSFKGSGFYETDFKNK